MLGLEGSKGQIGGAINSVQQRKSGKIDSQIVDPGYTSVGRSQL